MAPKAPDEGKSKRPADTPFKQQKLPAWRPILTPKAVIISFVVVGLVFLPIGGIVYTYSQKVIEVESENYVQDEADGGCCITDCDSVRASARKDRNPCMLTIEVTEDMEPPIYMYYKLTRFYQNHRMYVKSRDDLQLGGKSGMKPEELAATCKVPGSDSTLGWAADGVGIEDPGDNNTVLNSVSPCGLISYSLFNDSFRLEKVNPDNTTTPVNQSSVGIAWQSDVDTKFKNAKDGSSGNNYLGFAREKSLPCTILPETGTVPSAEKQAECEAAKADATDGMDPGWCYRGSGYCMEDEHFIVWMRTAGLPNFRKLYAKIDEKLYANEKYQVNIWNSFGNSPHAAPGSSDEANLFPVHTFKGEKYVVLSTTEWIGGRNDFLGIAYLVVGSICILLAIVFLIKCQCTRGNDWGRDPGSATSTSKDDGK